VGKQFEIAMDSERYDHWYKTARGQWIGQCETNLLFDALKPRSGESLLDVGCGTGFFTREMGSRINGKIIGVDINQNSIQYARQQESHTASYAVADARMLPFADAAFDIVISVTALCFISDMHVAIREMIRVSRRRFAIGLLNRHSLLWLQKGRGGGIGAYKGVHWYTVNEAKLLFNGLPVKHLIVQSVVHIPSGGKIAQWLEQYCPSTLFTGAFILVSGEVIPLCKEKYLIL
jgi:ubiquinone/menaquinone biosynthesis C-methylase UbiE